MVRDMDETREITSDDYRKLARKVYKASLAVHDEMDKLDAMTDDRWAELHDVTKMISAAYCTLERYAARQASDERLMTQLADAPVPYLPADHDDCQAAADSFRQAALSNAEISRGLDAAIKGENQDHVIFGGLTLDDEETVIPWDGS